MSLIQNAAQLPDKKESEEFYLNKILKKVATLCLLLPVSIAIVLRRILVFTGKLC